MKNVQLNQLWYHSVIIRIPPGTPESEFADAYISDFIYSFFNNETNVKDFVFQLERGSKLGKLHYQMYIHLFKKQRSHTLQKNWDLTFPDQIGVEFTSTAGIKACKDYCMKKETRVSGPWGKDKLRKYLGNDLKCMETPFKWQQNVLDIIRTKPDDRTIHYLWEKDGNVGKSKLVKYLEFNNIGTTIPLGNAVAVKYGVCSEPAARVYLIDLPRTLGRNEEASAMYSAIESIKNGFVKCSMYGKPKKLLMEPPHVFVYSNYPPPKEKNNILSADKWKIIHVTKE